MHILFVVATHDEWNGAKPSYLSPITPQVAEQKIHYFTDEQERTNGFLITGVGPINAALSMGRALYYLKRKHIVFNIVVADEFFLQKDPCVHIGQFNIGLAGSFDLQKAPLCTHWRITKEIYPEFGLVEGDTVNAVALGFPQWHSADNVVWDVLQLPELLYLQDGLRHSPIQGTASSLTVAGVTCCPSRAEKLSAPYTEPLLENMEGFSLALACARYNIPFLEIRTVSNLVGTRNSEFRAFGTALSAMQSVVEHLLSQNWK